ncbi:MAG: hypothetical protein ABSE22_17755 [Xanthobacteraceae bacterium]|jgi:hypothetical protein
MKPPKYTTEQIDEIVDRMIALRTRWLSVVTARLAARPPAQLALQERSALGNAKLVAQPKNA